MSKFHLLTAAGIAACTFAHAQQDSAASKLLEPVLVTANKFEQQQHTTGKIVTVIPNHTIERYHTRGLGQLLNDQAGITVNGALNSPGTRPSIFTRGSGDGRTLTLLDGMPLYDPSTITNEFDINLLSLANIEQIEVCRGAQSTLYGSDAVAGVINIITRKHSATKKLAIKSTLSAGSFETYKGNLAAFGTIGKFGYSVDASRLNSRGFSAATDTTNNGSDRDGVQSAVLSSRLNYRISKALSAQLFFQRSVNNTDLDAAAFTDEHDYTYSSGTSNAGVALSHNSAKSSLLLRYQLTRNKRFYLNDSSHVPQSTIFSTLEYISRSHFAEAITTWQLAKGVRLVAGIDFRSASMNSNGYTLSSFGPFESVFDDTIHQQYSAYTNLVYRSASNKLNADAGARLNKHSEYGTNATYTFTPSLSVSKSLRILGTIASAFKAPTLYQLYSPYGERALKPETSLTWELGVETKSGNNTARLVFFDRRIKNGIDFNYTTYKYYNSVRQDVQGIELETHVSIGPHLTVNANYTYLRSKEKSQSRITFKDTAYTYLLRRPAHSININAQATIFGKLLVIPSAKYAAKRFDIGGYMQDDKMLTPYVIFGLYAEYEITKAAKVFADVQNLSNKTFFDIYGYNSIPRTCSAGISFNL
jgi:vitamin B12 transporter